MDLDQYHRSFDEYVISIEEEAEARLRAFRKKCFGDFINRLTRHNDEWERTFRELLKKSQEEIPESRNVTFAEKPSIRIIDDEQPVIQVVAEEKTQQEHAREDEKKYDDKGDACKSDVDPFPSHDKDYFTNSLAVKEFIRLQEQQHRNRELFHDLNTNIALKELKNELNLFIRTQINSISNSDSHHINTKIRVLADLFLGQTIEFQNRRICASKHPQGQLFAMDLAAQTFVKVGTRLVNSVPAIAKSMASVINGIARNNLFVFKDLVVGHIQELCPFLIPLESDADFDLKSEKCIAHMRSMTLIYACILIQDTKGFAWSWLASFLSLKPRPVITATILQAFIQETSSVLIQNYGKQYRKLLNFIKTDYIKMIEEVTKEPGERQPVIRLSNQLDSELSK